MSEWKQFKECKPAGHVVYVECTTGDTKWYLVYKRDRRVVYVMCFSE